MAVPVLAALVAVPGKIDQQAAMAFFLVGSVHMTLMILSLKVAGTMVAGWQVFGLVPDKDRSRSDGPQRAPAAAQPAAAVLPRTAAIAPATAGLPPRRLDVAPVQTLAAANDTGPEGSVPRETRIVGALGTGGAAGQVAPFNPATSRTRGIGNRFRSATPAAPAAPAPKSPPPETYR